MYTWSSHKWGLSPFFPLAAVAICAALIGATALRAQDEEPEPAKPAAKAKPPAAKARPPAAAEKKAEKSKPQEKPAGKGESLAPEDPVIAAILAATPKTPSECFQAARTLARLHRPDLARPLLKQILAGKPDDQQWLALVKEFGSPALTDLSNQPELQPEAEQLAAAALGAVNRQLQDPKRIAELIRQLQDPSQTVRDEALDGLRQGRGAAVAALVAALADPARAAQRPSIQAALVAMRSDAVEPLAAILDSADAELMIPAAGVLADMKLPGLAIYLVGPSLDPASDAKVRAAASAALKQLLGGVPSRAQATQWLYERAHNYFRGRSVLKVGADSRVVLWSWDPTARQCVSRSVTVEDACRVMAARFARQAHALAPDDRQVKLLWLAATMDEMVYARGLDRPLDFEKDAGVRQMAELGAPTLESVLEYAMAEGHPAAARVAAEILGRIGTAKGLLREGREPAALVRAVENPDRRLRLAALEAIVRLQPDEPYAGSSRVPASLAFLAATRGTRRALLAGARSDDFQDFAAALAIMHVQADTATSGRAAVRMALESPDYEMLVIDAGIDDPNVATVVQELRQDYRTATLPILVMARAGFFERAERLARDDPRTLGLARPHSTESAQAELDQLSAAAPRDSVGFEERQQQAVRALACLATLASSSRKLYDLQRVEDAASTGLYVPGLGGRVAAVLANVPSRDSQLALVDLAGRHTQPLEVRQAAAKAFRISTEKYGLLLSDEAVRRQYDRYQRSKDLDPDSQRVLGSLLDSIEAALERSGTTVKPRAKSAAPPSKERPQTEKIQD
jgi:CheY-like chemotaxis protein